MRKGIKVQVMETQLIKVYNNNINTQHSDIWKLKLEGFSHLRGSFKHKVIYDGHKGELQNGKLGLNSLHRYWVIDQGG